MAEASGAHRSVFDGACPDPQLHAELWEEHGDAHCARHTPQSHKMLMREPTLAWE